MRKSLILLALIPLLHACTVQQVDYDPYYGPDAYYGRQPSVEIEVPDNGYRRPYWRRHHGPRPAYAVDRSRRHGFHEAKGYPRGGHSGPEVQPIPHGPRDRDQHGQGGGLWDDHGRHGEHHGPGSTVPSTPATPNHPQVSVHGSA